MMVKIMIILLASDDKGITLKLHLHGRLLARRATKNLEWGLFRSCGTKLGQFTIEIGTVFRAKLDEDQKKKKKSSLPALGSSFATES